MQRLWKVYHHAQSLKMKKIKFNKKKKALSPIVATVLLIAIVVFISLIVFIWLKGLTEESITKFGGRNIKLVCGDVDIEASYSPTSQKLSIINIGNVPIYSMKIQFFGDGSHNTKDFYKDYTSEWPSVGIFPGETFSVNISDDVVGKNKIVLIPVLVGTSKGGSEKAHVCDEKYGFSISL